jgi:hypothetical protein
VVDVEPGTHAATLFDPATTPWALKVLHLAPGHKRVDLSVAPRTRVTRRPERGDGRTTAYLANLPPAHPCPACGEVRFSAGPAGRPQRKCWGCDTVFDPTKPLAVLPGNDRPRRAREGRPVLLMDTDVEATG